MSKKNASGRRIAATLLVIALSACGSIEGAGPARAGQPAGGASGDNRLVEFDTNDNAGGSATPGQTGLIGAVPSYLPVRDQSFGARGQIDRTNAAGFGSKGGESANGPYLTE